MRRRLERVTQAALLVCALFPLAPRTKAPACERLRAGVQREEHFVLLLDSPGSSAQRTSVPKPVGLASWRARGGERSQVELEVRLFDEDLRVQHVETVDSSVSELVWREWRAGHGRTLRVRAEAGVLELVEWGRPEVLRVTLPTPDPVWLPLHLLEALRARAPIESALCFDPLGRCAERLSLREQSDAPESRRVRLSDALQACAGEFRFEGDVLAEFRWQAGALRAQAIAADEYATLEREQAARDQR